MTLNDICDVSTGMSDAHFWIQRRGTAENVGKPHKDFNAEDIGVKVKEEYMDRIVPDYLYYFFMHLHSDGKFINVSHGTLSLKHLRVEDIKRMPVSFT